MKKLLLLFIITFLTFGLVACSDDTDTNDDPIGKDDDTEELREFTLEELSEYDGLEGRDAYVAVDGYVYDMTDSSYWIDGSHQNQVQAGQDLTDEIDNSPHGRENLSRVPRIGIIVDSDDTTN